jgi:hypothetical protein
MQSCFTSIAKQQYVITRQGLSHALHKPWQTITCILHNKYSCAGIKTNWLQLTGKRPIGREKAEHLIPTTND